jgi:branched-chain amino acid transport system ATP-binding protein
MTTEAATSELALAEPAGPGPGRLRKAGFPLAVLFSLNLVDQADSSLLGVLAPEVKDAFGMSNQAFSLLLAANFLVLVGLSVYVGYLGDRLPRVRLVQLGAFIAGIGSILTGFAAGIWLLVFARIVNGAGILVNGPIHKSLLADYYDPDERGRVFGLHESATPAGSIVAPLLAGALAALLSWRLPFIVLGLPILACCLLALRLREPLRGGTDGGIEGVADAVEADLEPPVPFARAVRMMAQSRTLRRTWLGLVFFGAGFLPLVTFLALFYSTVFGVGPFERGVIVSVGAVAGLAGLVVAGAVVKRLVDAGREPAVQLMAGAAFVAVGVLVAAFALQATLPGALAVYVVLSFVGGFFAPASQTILSMVAPPRVRSQAFGFGFLFLGVGALLTPIAGGVADRDGLRWGLIAFAPLLVVGGLVVASAAPFVRGDQRRATDTLRTTAELRRARLDAADQALLLCRNVGVSYGQVQVLFGVDFEVQRGEIVALLGTNGAGKSTLLKAVAGLASPGAGLIFFDGEEVSSLTPWEASARGIVLMPGGKSVFPTMPVRENLRMAAYLIRGDAEQVDARMDEVLDIFPRLRERLDVPAGDLSGGEQQMVSLAQALMARPSLLMIDELSLGLAPKVVAVLIEIVRRIAATGVTIILVEQSVNVALTVAKRAYFMEKGEVRFTGPTEELLARPDILRAVFLEGAGAAKS